jgi:MYXO-CTERM domain-containing protein
MGTMLRFVRNGRTHETVAVDADPFETTLSVDAPPGDDDDRWRLELVSGTPRVLTSHIWVQATGDPVPPDAGPDAGSTGGSGDDGCGCRTVPRDDVPLGLALVLAALALLRTRRVSS